MSITVHELADPLWSAGLHLDAAGAPIVPVTVVDLDAPAAQRDLERAVQAVRRRSVGVAVGVTEGRTDSAASVLIRELDLTLSAVASQNTAVVSVTDTTEVAKDLEASVGRSPRAAAALVELLPQTAILGLRPGLAAESAAYSMLLAGPEFSSWRAAHPPRTHERAHDDVVAVSRLDDTLLVELDRPHRRNAFDVAMRDALADAFDLALLDPSVREVHLRGRGSAFCAGGDLDEFGSAPDAPTSHLIRLDRSVGARIDACRDRVTAYLHGACVGSGIELAAFAGTVSATQDTLIRLPELSMGLVPGAGGTVSITRRIGRWRTAYLALTGHDLDARTALAWGLVDRIDD